MKFLQVILLVTLLSGCGYLASPPSREPNEELKPNRVEVKRGHFDPSLSSSHLSVDLGHLRIGDPRIKVMAQSFPAEEGPTITTYHETLATLIADQVDSLEGTALYQKSNLLIQKGDTRDLVAKCLGNESLADDNKNPTEHKLADLQLLLWWKDGLLTKLKLSNCPLGTPNPNKAIPLLD